MKPHLSSSNLIGRINICGNQSTSHPPLCKLVIYLAPLYRIRSGRHMRELRKVFLGHYSIQFNEITILLIRFIIGEMDEKSCSMRQTEKIMREGFMIIQDLLL